MSGPHDHAAATDTGRSRDHNEDAILAQHPVFAVADGVGGSSAGEIASGAAVEVLSARGAEFASHASAGREHEILTALTDAVAAAHDRIRALQDEDRARAGMATTLSCMVLTGSRVVGAHVGDSRIYLVGRDGIMQITRDHSLVAELVRSGSISEAEARDHPQSNVILQALGAGEDVSIDTFLQDVPAGAWLVACSDGLCGPVTDEQIRQIILDAGDAASAAAALVDAANAAGGPDNISVVLVQPEPGEGLLGRLLPAERRMPDAPGATPEAATRPAHEAAPHPAPSMPRSRTRRWILAALATVVALVVAGFAWSQSYFLGEFDDGSVGIYRGFPVDAFSREYEAGELMAEDLSSFDREQYLDSPRLRSLDNARQLLAELEESHADTAQA